MLHHFFEQSADKYPEFIAIEYSEIKYTYQDIENKANQLAHYLKEKGIQPNDKIAIMLPRIPEVYIAMLGILKSGGAYIPLDPEIPGDRAAFIMEDSGAKLIITNNLILDRIGSDINNADIFNFDTQSQKLNDYSIERITETKASSGNLCYIIYTSGTTGKPKGVLLEHRNAVHYIQSAKKIYPLNAGERALQGFSVSFDASVEEIWFPFSVGATIVVGTFTIMRSGDQFSSILTKLNINFLSCAPTLLSMVEEDIPSLTILIFGGEVCPPQIAYRWCKPNRKVYNTYGPTEATVIATYSILNPEQAITIGVPMPDYIVEITDEQFNKVQGEAEGEILIGGEAVARGYINRDDLTADKFIETDKITGINTRFYRTGDRAKYDAKGEIIYCGRADDQVKVRGFRVELSEIEGLLLKCNGVKAAVVSLDKLTQQLSAYVVIKENESINRIDIAELLRSKLPYYMIPSTLDTIDELPMTISSKIDRNKLPKPLTPLTLNKNKKVILPQTEFEKEIIRVMEKHFEKDDISMDDDFFYDLGGHSLLAATVCSELRKNSKFSSISVIDIYNFTKISDLSKELESKYAKTANTQKRKADEVYKPSNFSYYSCMFFQGVSLLFIAFLYGLEWLGPFFVYSYYYQADYGVRDSLLKMFEMYFALLPILTVFSILFKWAVIGKIKAGKHKLWGFYYFRFWVVDKIINISPAMYFSGTPIINIYLRLLGAKIGKNNYINSHFISAFDLFKTGNNVSICTDSHLKGFIIKDGYIHIGTIEIGDDCFIGTRCCISENSKMSKNSSLNDLSLVPTGVTVPENEIWEGSPSEKIGINKAQPVTKTWNNYLFIFYLVGVFIFPLITMLAYFPGMMLITHIDYVNDDYRFLSLTLGVAVSFVVLLALIIATLKWLLLGNMKEGKYPVSSIFYYKKWFFDQLMKLSLQVIGTLYTTLYLQHWFKLLGVKIGKRSEISTVEFIAPDLVVAGDECFLADSVSVGDSHVRNGYITIAKTYIGNQSFIGNSAVLSPGTKIGDNVLIGVLSKVKADNNPVPDNTSWFGSPAVYLPKRDINKSFSSNRTYKPSRRLFIIRYFIEFFRVTLPATFFIMMASMITNVVSYMQTQKELDELFIVFPLLYIGASIIGIFLIAAIKWIVIGKYKPTQKPLWSNFVWRSELVTGLYENFAVLFFMNALTGSPFVKFPLWLLGCKIGKRTCIYTTQITEFDLVNIGDYTTINDNCTIQTHLFEDRVMKMSYVNIGKNCSIGGMSVVLYDTRMEDNSKLDNLSILMKGETLPANATFIGVPAKNLT